MNVVNIRRLINEIDGVIGYDGQVIQDLRILKASVKRHYERCNVAKTIGTSLNVAGIGMTIGSIFFPPLALAKYGIYCSLSGGIINLGTNFTLKQLMKYFRDVVGGIMDARNHIAQQHLFIINEILVQLDHERDPDSKSFMTFIDEHRELFFSCCSYVNYARFANLVSESGNLLNHSAAVGGKLILSDCETIAMNTIPFAEKIMTQAAMQATTVVIGVLVAVIEVKLLMKDWKNEAELALKIQSIIDQLNENIVIFRQRKAELERLIA